MLAYHLSLLRLGNDNDQNDETALAPIFMGSLFRQLNLIPAQYGLLAGVKRIQRPEFVSSEDEGIKNDPRVFLNITSPLSTFICGSQGSGKSHTLSCVLESCLLSSNAGRLSNPLTAVVFHYDTFICDNGGSPCEAAFLASHPGITVRVLCAPTNLRTIRMTYSRFNIHVEPLQIDQSSLNTKRMLDLMAVGQEKGPIPLYMHTVQRILREMRLLQQETDSGFDYYMFKKKLLGADLLPSQLEPLKQRLETLESFMPHQQVRLAQNSKKSKGKAQMKGSSWTPKYLKGSIDSQNFTDTLLSTVRLQRHLGARILISTQEPTISSDLLSLCSITIVHKFSSPAWLRVLQGHVAAAALGTQPGGQVLDNTDEGSPKHQMSNKLSFMNQIVDLNVGEALLFAPGAILESKMEGVNPQGLRRLGAGYMVVKIRERLTEDGGQSVLAA
ncbi:hypothetical protein EYB26_009294 [Talaromyces marneffei]|uniref:uncharacterized protein n=1 Tax=Talaromyces marneffei TaxID=37727 RepID=UPI0012A96487|nr:uncharacterized protein EYB26_009294 [Talaromyces marneffei]QGA21583.1 hypothetical protein EYB26_009294 [Talaromyces marneffei]